MQDWSATQYSKFEDERTRPVRDLIHALPLVGRLASPLGGVAKIVDIGCGPGNSTEMLAKKWSKATISGFDSSPDMVEKAKKRLPDLSFSVEDIYQWSPDADTDLLFSNAVFQWLPDHIDQMTRLLNTLKDHAVFAVQLPDNLHEPLHQNMIIVAQDKRWQSRLGKIAREKLPPISVYYDAFQPVARHIDIWHTIYNHVMDSHQAIVEWVKGAALKPFLDRLNQDEQQEFLALYLERIKATYPMQQDGKVLLAFPRLFMVLVK